MSEVTDKFFRKKITSHKTDIEGFWHVKLECGHSQYDRTRKDCKKYKKESLFCGICYMDDDNNFNREGE